MAVAFLLSWALREVPLRSSNAEPEVPSAPPPSVEAVPARV